MDLHDQLADIWSKVLIFDTYLQGLYETDILHEKFALVHSY